MQISSTVYTLLFCFIGLNAQSQAIKKNKQVEKMQLVWSDEFNYTGLPDPTKWNYDVGVDGARAKVVNDAYYFASNHTGLSVMPSPL